MIKIIIFNPFFITFLALPPFIIFLRHIGKLRAPRWMISLGFVLVGWALLNLAVFLHFEMLGRLVENTANPPQEWIDEWTNDGGKRVFALFFGWSYAVVYFLLWYIAVWIATKTVCFFRKPHA